MTTLDELDARSRRLVAAVLVAPSIAEAARRVGYSDKTARRMLARPEVRAAARRGQPCCSIERTQRARARIGGGCGGASTCPVLRSARG